MLEELPYHEFTSIPDKTFPLNVFTIPYPHLIPPHWHEHLEWILVRKGAFRIQIENQFSDLNVGEVLFVNSREIHAAFPQQEDTELIAIVFNEALLRNFELDNTERKYVLPIINQEVIAPRIFKKDHPVTNAIAGSLGLIFEEFQNQQKGFELFIKSQLIQSMAWISRMSENKTSSGRDRLENSSLQKILRHLSSQFHQPISIKEAASICNLSPNYFCYLFKKATGKTFIEYVNMLRVHEADRLLREGSLTVSEAAYRAGFTNLTYFGRVFKKYKTYRPSDILKQR